MSLATRTQGVMRAAALLALLAPLLPGAAAHGIHAYAQGRAVRALVIDIALLPARAYSRAYYAFASANALRFPQANVGQSRADFLGVTQYSASGCSNALTCGPSYCVRASNTEAPNNKANVTDADLARQLLTLATKSCTISTDARCTKEGLTALFGAYPGVKAACVPTRCGGRYALRSLSPRAAARYCNDAWLVIHSNNLPNHPVFLQAIQTPPGDGDGGQYSTQGVTRSYSLQWYAFKVPLTPQLLPTATAALNNAGGIGFAAGDDLYTTNSLTRMPTSGPASYTLSGMPWFPNLNNAGGLTWPSCEVDECNAHAGKGFDYHYHGDPFGPQCMYSCASYASLDAHPPMVGYGIDGIPIFGRYLDASAPGASAALDDCGGHVHTGMGTTASAFPFVADNTYHYHAFVQTIATNGDRLSYTAYANGPYMCFKGNLSAFPNLWLVSSPTATAAYGAGNLQQRTDYVQTQPCSGMTTANAYVAKGYSLPGIAAVGTFGDEGLTSVGAGSVGAACTAAGVTTYVAATLSLGGYSAATFGTGEAAAFRAAVAAKASTTAASVIITAVADAAAGRRRVHAAAAAVSVSFTVVSASAQSTGVVTALTALAVTDFTAQGLQATSAAVTAAPAATQTVPAAASGLPTTAAVAAPAAGKSGASTTAAALAPLTLLAALAAVL